MGGFFESLARMAGRSLRKGKWVYQSLTGDDDEAIEAEHSVGMDLARQTLLQMPPDPRTDRLELVEEIGGQLAKWVANPHRRFEFHVVQAGDANAFALPGGFIFLTGSLMDLCRLDRDELAFIAGHEMAHVIRRHPLERIVMGQLVSTATRVAPVAGVLGGIMQGIAARFVHSAYWRDQEMDADLLALRLGGRAGFRGEAAVALLHRLHEAAAAQAPLTKYFSSHPALDDRVANIRQYLAGK